MKLEKNIYSVSKNLDNLLNNKCIQSIFISLSSVSTKNNYKYNLNNDDKEIDDIMNCFFNAIQNNDSSNILDSFDIIFRSLPKYKKYIDNNYIKAKLEIYRMIFCQNNINFDLLNNNYYQNFCKLKMSVYYSISSCRNEMNKYSHDDFDLWCQFLNVMESLHVLLDTIYCNKDAKDKYSIYYNNILKLFAVSKKIKNKGYCKVSDDTKDLAKVLLCIYNNYHNYCK